MEIKTFIGRKLNSINGILRRQIELDRYLKNQPNLKLTYDFYYPPKNPFDFFSKRYVLYPYYSRKTSKNKDIINHITYQYLGDLAFFLDKNKTVITCHDPFNFIERGNIKNPFIVQKYSLLGLKQCKYIIAVSDFTKNELINRFGISKEKITVIKNSINHELFYPIPNYQLNSIEPLFPEYKKILYVGTEINRKDFVTLLKAFYLIEKKRKDIILIRVGKPEYANTIKELGLEKKIIYLNNVSDKRLREIYNLCEFFVYPSIYEGFGFPGLEAAACGLPIICTDIPVFRELYQKVPLYFPPSDYKALAKIVLENINNEEQKIEMQKNGLEIVKNFSWKKSAEKYYKILKNIIEMT